MAERKSRLIYTLLAASVMLSSGGFALADDPVDGLTQTTTTTTTTTTKVIRAGSYPATKRDEASVTAKQLAGREDPMKGLFERTPYPGPWTKVAQSGGRTTSDDEKAEAEEKAGKEGKGSGTVPPPPPPVEATKAPPPPAPIAADAPPELPIENLPQPPEKPMVSPSLKLTAIIGNKAVLEVPFKLRIANKWPSTISLGPGERFEDPANGSFSVVSVDPDSVTIEEESERSVKSLPQIK